MHVARRFARNDWGGTETVILETSRQLVAMGHEAEIQCTLATADCASESIGGIPVIRHPYFYPYLGLSKAAQDLLDRKGGSPFSFALMRALRDHPSADLFHLHVLRRIGGIARHVARRRGIPYVITLHGGVFDVPASESASMLAPARGAFEWGKVLGWWVGSRRLLADADAIVCVGRAEREAVQRRYPRGRVVCIPNGVDADRFAAGDGPAFRRRQGISNDDFVLATIARIDDQKNQAFLVRTLPRILELEPRARVLLVGHVTRRPYLEALRHDAVRAGVADRLTIVEGLGPASQDLVDAYHAADVFVLPSLHEPFGIAILEAWAACRPVLANRVGGVVDFLEDGLDGLLFDAGDEGTFMSALARLVRDRALRAMLGSAGQAKVRRTFTWQSVTAEYVRLYEEVSAGRRRSG